MLNPFDLIPETLDKNLRDFIISVVAIQFFAFLIFFCYITYQFIQYKLYGKRIDKLVANAEQEEKNKLNYHNEDGIRLDEIKFDNEDEETEKINKHIRTDEFDNEKKRVKHD